MAWTDFYVRADANGSGDGTTDTNSGVHGAWTLAQAISNAVGGDRVNIMGHAGTIANTTTDRDFNVSGSATQPIWWRGCQNTIGDCDTNFALAVPSITSTTGRWLVSGGNQIFSNLNWTGQQVVASGGQLQVYTGSSPVHMDRVTVQNTSANAESRAMQNAFTGPLTCTRCTFIATSTANDVVEIIGVSNHAFSQCSIQGGINGLHVVNGANVTLHETTIRGFGTDGVLWGSTGGRLDVYGGTIYGPSATNGVEIAIAMTVVNIVRAYIECPTGIHNTTGTNITNVFIVNPDFLCSTANLTGLGDVTAFSQQTESSSAMTSSTNLTPKSGSNARANGATGGFPGESYTSYVDIGAVQHQDSGGGIVNQVIKTGNIGTY